MDKGFLTATDLADYLAKNNVPFRKAHHITGNIVAYCENNNKNLYLPSPRLSTDNAAMICVAAKNELITNKMNIDDIRLSSIIS